MGTQGQGIAGQLAALDLASHGRAYLGLARGTWFGAVGLAQSRPLTALAALAEAAEVVYRGRMRRRGRWGGGAR